MTTEPRYDRIIRGDVVLSDSILEDGFVAVRDGKIVAIGQGEHPPAEQVDDHPNSFLFPGLIDSQVHAGSVRGLEGLADATRAAAAGGVTTIVDMPFDDPDPVNSVERLEAKIAAIERLAVTNVALYVTPPPSLTPEWAAQMAAAGAAAIKISTYEYHPIRFPRTSTGAMYELFQAAAAVKLPVAFHNEDEDLVRHFMASVSTGERTPAMHGRTRPPIAELVADAQVLELASHTGVRSHIVHSSLAAGCAIASHYRRRGAQVTVETCLHYLVLNEADMLRRGALLKINPPLRSEAERQALWGSLDRGEIDLLSTDHVAWPEDRKRDPDIFKNASGAPGLEALLPVLYTAAVVERGYSPFLIARLTAENPARHFGLFPRKGKIAVGFDADIAVLTREARVLDASRLISEVKWSPYEGMKLGGIVACTYVGGRKVFADGNVIASPGSGCFVRPYSMIPKS